jgi:hypothetical protein
VAPAVRLETRYGSRTAKARTIGKTPIVPTAMSPFQSTGYSPISDTADFLRAAGPGARVSVKLSVRPRDAGHQARAEFVAAALAEVGRALAAAHAITASSAEWS